MSTTFLQQIIGVSMFDPTREHDMSFFELGLGLNGFGS